jgi:thymidine kinase
MSITLIKGGMWAGKTTELFRLIDRARHAGQSTILYKYDKDVRFGKERAFMASSHGGIHKDAIPIDSFEGVSIPPSGTVVGIEEGQFINELCAFAENAALNGCHVIITALSSDYERKLFPRITELIPLCDHEIVLHAVCFDCKKDAAFTKRIIASTELEVIGGAEAYKAVCRACYHSQQCPSLVA